jgi:flagellar hook-basal body complex protein FliE
MSADRINTSVPASLDSAIAKMQALAKLAAGSPLSGSDKSAGTDFQGLLQNAIRAVNEAQNDAQAKAQSFSTGDANMTLEEVMVSMQNANLAFQGMIAVRNKLVEAYREVINLQV